MKLHNPAVDFYEIKQESKVLDFLPDIPFEEYLYSEALPQKYLSITDFGASQNADYNVNTRAVNEAISVASENGGGVVLIPEGVFVTSTIILKSNVTLFVKGTLKCVDYETNLKADEKLSRDVFIDKFSKDSSNCGGYIFSDGAENITICGGGRIDGSGASFCKEAESPELLLPLEKFHLKSYIMAFRNRIRFEKENSGRVNLVELTNGKNIDIHNIEFYESGRWTCNLFQCKNIKIEDVVINSNFHVANTDGFDLSCCQNARINHCFIATGDDALCIKGNGNMDNENILIENCKAMSLANCFKIGTTIIRNVKNVTVRNCEFFMKDTTGGYAGISVESDMGGVVENITAENITMDGVTAPFVVWLGNRYGSTPGAMKNVTIENITAKNVSLPSAVTGTLFKGKTYKPENISIKNVKVEYRDSEEEIYVRPCGVGLEAMDEYPEITRLSSIYISSHEESPYWELPAYGMYVRYTENLLLENFSCIPRSCNKRQEFFFEE